MKDEEIVEDAVVVLVVVGLPPEPVLASVATVAPWPPTMLLAVRACSKFSVPPPLYLVDFQKA